MKRCALQGKRKYHDAGAAAKYVRRGEARGLYLCAHCGFYHLYEAVAEALMESAAGLVRRAANERRIRDAYGPAWAIGEWDGHHRRGHGDQDGYVYFIQAGGSHGPVKIGFTTDPNIEKRRCSLQTGNPQRLRTLASVPGSRSHEQLLHRMFNRWQMEGEWFRGRAPGLLDLARELGARLPL